MRAFERRWEVAARCEDQVLGLIPQPVPGAGNLLVPGVKAAIGEDPPFDDPESAVDVRDSRPQREQRVFRQAVGNWQRADLVRVHRRVMVLSGTIGQAGDPKHGSNLPVGSFGSFAQLVLDKRTFLLLVEMATREIELARVLALLGVAETQADELRPMLDAQFHANLHAMMTIENLVSASYDISNTYWQLYMQTL